MEAIPLCDITDVYINIYTQQYTTTVSNYNFLFSAWRHVSAAHAAIFRPA